MGRKRKKSSSSDGEADGVGFDLRLDRRLKRRCVATKDIKLNSVGKNSFDQGKYSGAGETNSVNLDIDEDFVDADYKKYLDSFSSVLTGHDTVPNHRTSDSGGDNENMSDVRNLETNNIEIGANRKGYLDILAPVLEKANSEEELVGNKCVNNDANKKTNSDCIDSVADSIEKDTFRNFPQDSGRTDVDGGSSQTLSANNHLSEIDNLDKPDPEYDIFLKNMSKHGNDTLSNFSEDSGHIDVDGSQNDDLDDNPDSDLSPKNVREDENGIFGNLSDGGSFQTRSGSQNDNLDNNDPDYEFFLRNVRKEGTSFVLQIPGCDGISQIIKYELVDGRPVENPDTTRCSQEGSFERDLLDDSYENFIKSLKNERGRVVYMAESGSKVVYDEDEESSSDSDVVILETNQFSQSYEIPTDDEKRGCYKGASKNDYWFREKVVEILRKPFDQEEYKRLLHQVQVHKPVIEDREMRYGRSRQRIMHALGKSYLDAHKDLARKICSAGPNMPKVLNLLRGFFYWLQNTPHHVFKPWEDEACLQVLPSEVAASRHVNI